jgi:hypothetical protein
MSEPAPAPTPGDSSPGIDPAPAPLQSAEPSPGIFGDGLAFRDGWFNDVTDPALDPYRSMAAQFKDLPTVFKSLHDTKAALSQRTDGMLRMPAKDATPEEVSAFHRALGVPESPDKYQITPPAQLPDGVEFRPETLTAFTEFAHQAGITQEQANRLIAFQAQMESEEVSRLEAEHRGLVEAQEKQLQREWGSSWEQRSMLAKRAAETFGLGADHPALANADIRRALARAAELISEDKLTSGEKVTGVLSPANEAKDILKNPDNAWHKAYHNAADPRHQEALAHYMNLMKKAYS